MALSLSSDWRWVTGVTPLTAPKYVAIAIPAYLVTIFTLQWFMKNREPLVLKQVARVHNLILCVWSAVMSFGTIFEIGRLWYTGEFTPFDLFCDAAEGKRDTLITGTLGLLCYSYFVSKFYELLDTVLMVLKKRTLTFLHVYHHCVILYIVWGWNNNHYSQQWWAVIVNAGVHVAMYYYYFVASVRKGYKPWWRIFITQGQILQFVTVFVNMALWYVISLRGMSWHLDFPFLRYTDSVCTGDVWIVNVSFLVNCSFLYLFTAFFLSTYGKPKGGKTGGKGKGGKGKKGGEKSE